MEIRQGMARDLDELNDQVAACVEIDAELADLQAERDELNVRLKENGAAMEALKKKREPIHRVIARFYRKKGAQYFSKGTKTIKLPSGYIGGRQEKYVRGPKRKLIRGILEMGPWYWFRYLRIEPHLNRLKNAPGVVERAGGKVVTEDFVMVGPPKKSKRDDG